MNLSAEQFAAVVSNFNELVPLPDSEKRRASRVIHTCRVPIIFGHESFEERRETVTILDLSSRGVGLLHTQKLRRGEQFVLQLNRPKGAPAMLLCAVAHCRRHAKGIFAVGAEFTCVLNPQALADTPVSKEDVERIQKMMLA
jgi:hypothetical protein